MAEVINMFHYHLDRCKQCREQPFNLCRTGALLLSKSFETRPKYTL
jgi:hypothetical protein